MKKHLTLLTTCCFILNGCATTIITKGQLPYGHKSTSQCDRLGSVTLTAFQWSDWYLKEKQVSLRKWPEFEKLISESIRNSNCFSSVKTIALPAEASSFNSEQAAWNLLKLVRGKTDTKYIFDVYSYSETRGYHGNGLFLPYVIWLTAHFASIGIIPVWVPAKITLKAKIRDTAGHEVADVEVTNSASQWTWSPFIFSSEAIKTNEAAEKSEFFRNTVNALSQEIVRKLGQGFPNAPK